MMFSRMRKGTKVIVAVIAVAFVGGLLYAGGTSLFGRTATAAVAVVNGTPIPYTAFYQVYFNILQQQQLYGQPISGQMLGQIQYYALDQLINQQLLFQAAEDAKIKVEEAAVNERYQAIQDSYSSKELFEEDLKNAGLTASSLRAMLRDSLKIERLQEEVLKEVQVTEEEIRAAYEQVNARHILIRPEEDTDEAREAALRQAEQLIEQLKGGADFAELAKEYSDDPGSGASGGELGWFGRGRMVEPFEKAAFAAAVGEIVGPVESQFGYHIIQVTERKEAEGDEFEQAKEELRQQLLQQKNREKLNEWFAGLKAEAKIEIKDPAIRGHKLMWEGAYEEAIEAYKEALKEYDSDPYLHSSLAHAYQHLDQVELALEHYQAAAEIAETDPELWMMVGTLHQEQGNNEKAIEAYKKASDAAPMDMLVHLQLLSAYQQMGEEELVKEEEEKILAINKAYEEMRQASQESQSEAEQTEGEPAEVEEPEAGGSVEEESAAE
ncbi:MAG TPA: tetratricopeptide repeat protein [Firmicutes bacterium]|nr:tetratricopeptide repeat protein [Bacillota bacterium]